MTDFQSFEDEIVRAEGYRVLAMAFRYPDPDALREELRALEGSPLAPIGETLEPLVDDTLAGEYNRVFSQNTLASPYETSYQMGDKGARLGQIAEIYRSFGVKVGGAELDSPDHVAVELEFAALLSLKEAICLGEHREEELAVTRQARRIFLEEHVGAWVPRFARRVLDGTAHPFYRAAVTVLDEWIGGDLGEHGWTPVKPSGFSLDVLRDDEPLACATERA